mgnify:CR=1 FL=1
MIETSQTKIANRCSESGVKTEGQSYCSTEKDALKYKQKLVVVRKERKEIEKYGMTVVPISHGLIGTHSVGAKPDKEIRN